MDDRITTFKFRSIHLRTPYLVLKLPFLCRWYRFAYDHSSLSDPSVIRGWRTPFRIGVKILFLWLQKLGLYRKVQGLFRFIREEGSHQCHFSAMNTQFHALYFARFWPCYEPEVCALLDILVESKTCFYDIGANWGYFTGYVATHPRFKGQIHAFEPQEKSFFDLKRFIHEAKLQSIAQSHRLALSEHKGVGTLFSRWLP